MMAYNPSQPLIGLHIPKCAGSSMQQVLHRWFGRQMHWHYFDEVHNRKPKRCVQTPLHQLLRWVNGRNVCIYGHFNRVRGFGVEDYYPDTEHFFTIVRDPLQTALSRYFSAKCQDDRRLRGGKSAPMAARYMTLDAFIAGQIDRPYMVNYFPDSITMETYPEIFETRFVYIGIAENLQISVDQLATRLGFASISVPHVNVSRHDETLNPALAAEFIARRPLEYAIYQYALEHYRDPA